MPGPLRAGVNTVVSCHLVLGIELRSTGRVVISPPRVLSPASIFNLLFKIRITYIRIALEFRVPILEHSLQLR